VTRQAPFASDVAIIGAGVIGLSIAFQLAERRVGSVVVYEKKGIGAGASGVQPGGVRQQWSTRLNCVMARESLGFYTALRDRLRPLVDPGFRPCGYLFVAHEPSTLDRLRADVAVQNEAGVPSRLLTAEEAARIVPSLQADEVVGASFCQEDGYFDRPQAVVEAFARAATRLGVIVTHADVSVLEPVGNGWRLSLADGRTAEAGRVVAAGGIDTPALLGPLGTELPIVAEDRWLFFSEPLEERLLEPLVVAPDRRFAAKQLADGRLLASDLAARGQPGPSRELWRRRVREIVVELLPVLEFVDLPHLVHGVYDLTPDSQGIVGPVPGQEGLFVAAGFNGHGFMMAPAIGRGAAAMVVGEDPGEGFAHLRPDRFEQGTLSTESAVV
jgi:sarcosine oxidase, subunit beta